MKDVTRQQELVCRGKRLWIETEGRDARLVVTATSARVVSFLACGLEFPLDDANQRSGSSEYANAMSKAGMDGARKDKLHAELLDPAQTLEFWRAEQRPGDLVHSLIRSEDYQAVDRVPQRLDARLAHGSN
jgi:hypothetical protein